MEIAAQFNSKVAPQHPLVVGAMNRQAQLQDEPEIFLQPADIRGIVQTVRQCGWNGGLTRLGEIPDRLPEDLVLSHEPLLSLVFLRYYRREGTAELAENSRIAQFRYPDICFLIRSLCLLSRGRARSGSSKCFSISHN